MNNKKNKKTFSSSRKILCGGASGKEHRSENPSNHCTESSKSVKARAIVEKVSKKGKICVRPCRDPDRREKGRVQTSIIVL